MGFFHDLKEDLSQAVSEITGEERFDDEAIEEENEESTDLFAAAEESMGIEHSEEESSSVEASLGAFIDQVAANAESIKVKS